MTQAEIKSLISQEVQEQVSEQLTPILELLTNYLDHAFWVQCQIFPCTLNGRPHASYPYMLEAGTKAWQQLNALRKRYDLPVSACQEARGVKK